MIFSISSEDEKPAAHRDATRTRIVPAASRRFDGMARGKDRTMIRSRNARPIASTLAVAGVLVSGPARAQSATPPDHPLLPAELETEWALSAAPAHLRDGAAVYLLTASGYVQSRPGTNAFTCLVNRRGGDLFPVCWDAEGARTLMAVDIDVSRRRLAGASSAALEADVAARYADGRLHPPSRPGVAYMLSPLRVRIDERGTATRVPATPHPMFYAPNLTDADIGGKRPGLAFINTVGPAGMMIVPVGAEERRVIEQETAALVARIQKALGVSRP
jgi:hypothetical protein